MLGVLRQTAIYRAGVSGRRPRVPTDATQLEARARKAMPREAYAYIAGGAGTGATVRANREGFDRWRIVPRMLRDVSERDTAVELLRPPARDRRSCSCPVGVLEMVDDDADLAVARAARAEGVPMIFSNQASRPMEACARELGDSPALVPALLEHLERPRRELRRARRGVRLRGDRGHARHDDARLAHARPRHRLPAVPARQGDRAVHERPGVPADHRRGARGARQGRAAASRRRPRCARSCSSRAPTPTRFVPSLRSGHARAAVQTFTRIYSRPSLTWEDLPFLRERTKLPILLKGILHPDDARRAIDEGIDGIVVSNHGGRQVDGATSTIEALPGIAAAVDGRIPIVLDSRRARRRRRVQGARARRDRGRPRPPVRLRAGDRRRGRRARGAAELQGRLRPHARPRRLPLGRRDRARRT